MKTVTVEIYGRKYVATLLAIHPHGTIDVQLADGRCFRVSGLSLYAAVEDADGEIVLPWEELA